MKGFLKKLAICLSLGLGVMALASCEGTNLEEAKIQQSSFQIVEDVKDGDYYAEGVILIKNNTIYNVRTWDISYSAKVDIYSLDGQLVKKSEVLSETYKDVEGYVLHGQAGGVVVKINLSALAPEGMKYVPLSLDCNGGVAHSFDNLWNSYVGWWIVAIVIVAVALVFFGIELLGKRLSRQQVIEAFKTHVASSIVFGLFMLIICLFPLIFGAWFSTIILLLALAGSFVGAGLIAGIALLTVKE